MCPTSPLDCVAVEVVEAVALRLPDAQLSQFEFLYHEWSIPDFVFRLLRSQFFFKPTGRKFWMIL